MFWILIDAAVGPERTDSGLRKCKPSMFFPNADFFSSWLFRRNSRRDAKAKAGKTNQRPKGPVYRKGANDVVTLPWGRTAWCVSRQLGNSEALTVGRVHVRAGMDAPPHRHPNCEEVLHVVSGRIEQTIADATFTLESGDTAVIPPGVWHRIRALGQHDAHLIVCFSAAHRVTEFGVQHAGSDPENIQ